VIIVMVRIATQDVAACTITVITIRRRNDGEGRAQSDPIIDIMSATPRWCTSSTRACTAG